MFRLANAQFGAYTEITKMVSANLINMIENKLIYGELPCKIINKSD